METINERWRGKVAANEDEEPKGLEAEWQQHLLVYHFSPLAASVGRIWQVCSFQRTPNDTQRTTRRRMPNLRPCLLIHQATSSSDSPTSKRHFPASSSQLTCLPHRQRSTLLSVWPAHLQSGLSGLPTRSTARDCHCHVRGENILLITNKCV